MYAQVTVFGSRRSPELVAASARANRDRIEPAITSDPQLRDQLVSLLVLRRPDGGEVVVTVARSQAALLRARDVIISTRLLPGEQAALLPGSDRVEICEVVDARTYAPATFDEQGNAAVVRRYFDVVWNRGDLSAIDDLFGEEFTNFGHHGPDARTDPFDRVVLARRVSRSQVRHPGRGAERRCSGPPGHLLRHPHRNPRTPGGGSAPTHRSPVRRGPHAHPSRAQRAHRRALGDTQRPGDAAAAGRARAPGSATDDHIVRGMAPHGPELRGRGTGP